MGLGDQVTRFAHGSRVPGWDDAVDPAKDPAPVPDPAEVAVPDDLRAEIEGHMAKYPDRRSATIPALAAAQRLHGWCSPLAISQVAAVMRLTPGYVVAVASFYDQLDTTPVGRHRVYVCTNISCSLRGGDELLEALEHEMHDDLDVHVRHFECLGACDIAPMASIDGVYVGPIELEEVPLLAQQIRAGEAPLPDKQILRRASTDPTANSREFPRVGGDEFLPQPAVPGAANPVRPAEQGTYGEPMPGDVPGPSAPLERPADSDQDS
jgi:NADH-quinone oxidoreductase subunit E